MRHNEAFQPHSMGPRPRWRMSESGAMGGPIALPHRRDIAVRRCIPTSRRQASSSSRVGWRWMRHDCGRLRGTPHGPWVTATTPVRRQIGVTTPLPRRRCPDAPHGWVTRDGGPPPPPPPPPAVTGRTQSRRRRRCSKHVLSLSHSPLTTAVSAPGAAALVCQWAMVCGGARRRTVMRCPAPRPHRCHHHPAGTTAATTTSTILIR